ncbi:uncharacterized protein LOC126857013 [Cataglyphis hispanica]|uniref:uncharacterized protein LOC126857013 n=1 Tax=Cataglyphis hispanica TaxID=1086592 RepID=UPI00217F8E2F|nr:uncharacterized protein LOC126857013 [Cataglyphis hispanica]
MKTVYYLLGLLSCVSLPLITGLDLGEIIKTAQCQSSCLRNLTTDDKCWNVGKDKNTQCEKCWQTCELLGPFNNKTRLDICKNCALFLNCSSCEIACTFYRTYGVEENQYDPTKLPAPEKDEIIRMNKHDMAITMRKNLLGTWEMDKHYTANQKVIMKPGDWIIITNENGAIKHYSWEKWWPTLQSLKDGPLFQANITWMDWQTQLNKQREKISLPGDKIFLELRNKKKRKNKSSFVVTWQEETGNGIMGNQVADSESAQISLPPGRYSIRVATNDGPGSYSIVIDTADYKIESNEFDLYICYIIKWDLIVSFLTWLLIVLVMILVIFIKAIILKRRKNKNNIDNIEMACPTAAEMKSNKLNILIPCFKYESNQTDSDPFANSYTDYINEQAWTEIDINANANMQDANVQNVNVNVQDANANIQDVTANTRNVNTTNVIQQM